MDFKISDNDFGFEQGITIVTVNGKSFPYSTSKTLAQLIEDIHKLPLVIEKSFTHSVDIVPGLIMPKFDEPLRKQDNLIQAGDIVKCIDKNKAQDGQNDDRGDLIVGKQYEVQEVIKKNGVTLGYEIVGIDVDFPIRIMATKDEIEFVNRPELPEKRTVLEMVETCECKQQMVLLKGPDGIYTGPCKCGRHKEVTLEPVGS